MKHRERAGTCCIPRQGKSEVGILAISTYPIAPAPGGRDASRASIRNGGGWEKGAGARERRSISRLWSSTSLQCEDGLTHPADASPWCVVDGWCIESQINLGGMTPGDTLSGRNMWRATWFANKSQKSSISV